VTDWKLPWEAGCRCDRLRMAISAAPLMTMACHCKGCQRMTGSAFSVSVLLPASGFSILRGETVIGGLRGSPRHHFCSYCMSWAFTRPEGLDHLVNLRATLLDDPSWFSPFMETCTREKLPWATTPAVRSYEAMPPYEDFARLVEEYARTATYAPGRSA
jgi:hypothetical protein